MKRYTLNHPHTCNVHYNSMQACVDDLFNFRNSPDFFRYRIFDNETGVVYRVSNDWMLNAIVVEDAA